MLLLPDSHSNPTVQSQFVGDVSPEHPSVSFFASLSLPHLPSTHVRATAQCRREPQVQTGPGGKIKQRDGRTKSMRTSRLYCKHIAYLVMEVKKRADFSAHTYKKQ